MTQRDIVFDVTPDTAVVTTTYVTKNRMPILYVTHELDEDGVGIIWQFHCGNDDYDPAVLQLVALHEIVAIDPTVAEVRALPLGFAARRAALGEPWTMRKDES